MTLFQCGMAYAVRNCSWGAIFVLGWAVSGFCNQNLFCAQHELSHFLAYKKPLHNKILSIVSNCPLVVPTATTFRKYHQEHHSHLVRLALKPERCWLCLCAHTEAVVRTYGSCGLEQEAGLLRPAVQPQDQHLCAGTGSRRASHNMAARWRADWHCCPCMQGVEGWDVDLPTYLEANYIATFVIKVVWVCCYILVYGIRPVVIRPKKVGESSHCSQTPLSGAPSRT